MFIWLIQAVFYVGFLMNSLKLQFKFLYCTKLYFMTASKNCTLKEVITYLIENIEISFVLDDFILYHEESKLFINENIKLELLGIDDNEIILII